MKTKRILSMLTAVILTVSTSMFTVSAEDNYATRGEVCGMLLTAADDYNPTVQKSDILKGYEDGDLHEERSVTRAEALVMLKRAFGNIPEIKGKNKYIAIPKEEFTDIPDWAQGELAEIFDAGIVAGKSEGIFAPDDHVTVEEMKLFISRMYRVFGTNEKDDFYTAINKEAFDSAVIPDGKSVVGTLYNDITSDLLEAMMKEISASNTEKNSKKENFDYKKMFESYAKIWMTIETRGRMQNLAAIDTHSPSSIRTNRVLQSCDKFYEVYGITDKDGMWVAPEDRVSIW